MNGWEQPVNGETEAERRERLAKAAAHEEPPFDGVADTDRRFIRDVLRATRPPEEGTWRDRGPLL
jgi:hypothetical protein